MRHVGQGDVDGVAKAPHQAKWRKALRAVLLNPGITDAQRAAVQQKLADISKGKDYGARIPNEAGIKADTPPWGILRRRVMPSKKALSRMTKAELTAHADRLGVPVDPAATKAAIISTIEEREK